MLFVVHLNLQLLGAPRRLTRTRAAATTGPGGPRDRVSNVSAPRRLALPGTFAGGPDEADGSGMVDTRKEVVHLHLTPRPSLTRDRSPIPLAGSVEGLGLADGS